MSPGPIHKKNFSIWWICLVVNIVRPTDTRFIIIANSKRRLKWVRNIVTTIVNTVCEVAQGHIQLRYLISNPNLNFIMHTC